MQDEEYLAERLRIHLQKLQETKKLAQALERRDCEKTLQDVIDALRKVSIN